MAGLHAREDDENSLIYLATSSELRNNVVNYKTIVDKILGKSFKFTINSSEQTGKEINSIKKTLTDKYVNEFFKRIRVSDDRPSKFREYQKVKNNYGIEKYLLNNDHNNQFISKIRLSCHHFPNEIGRWKKIDKNYRHCFYCNTDSVGDEFHVLFNCNYQPFSNERKTFLTK